MATAPEPLEFRILGGLDVLHGGRRLEPGTRQQRAVLLVLLLDPGRPVGVDRIVDRVWGERPPASVTSTLHAYVSRLRRALGVAGEPIERTAAGYRLRVDREQVDGFVFEALAGRGREALARGDLAGAQTALADSLALWRGPCLPEFADEVLAQPTIDRLDGLRLLAVEDLFDVALALGRHAESIVALEQLVAENPLRERIWGQLVVALYRSGRQADALRALRAVRRVLADQLGVDPAPALRALERQVLAQDEALEAPVRPTFDLIGDAGRDGRPGAVGFVGRRRELDLLSRSWQAASSGSGQVVVVSGEPGVGKTALTGQLEQVARRHGGLVLHCRCADGAGAPALWPWMQALRTLRDEGGLPAAGVPAGLVALLPKPDVSPGPAGAPDTVPSAFATGRALADLLAAVGRRRPILLVLDDLHGADLESLEVLQVVAAALAALPVLLVVTHRSGPEAGRLVRALGDLARGELTGTLHLDGLDVTEIEQLLSAHRIPSGSAASALRERTGGNPFFVGELLRAARQGSRGEARSRALTSGLPPAVRDVVRARLVALPARTTEVLAAAAVLGREIRLGMLAAVVSLDRGSCAAALDPALAAELVLADGPGISRLQFSHALVRDTVLSDLSAVRVARLHARCAEVLLRTHRSDDELAEPIAHHVLSSAGLVPAEQAVPAVVRAADLALARGAHAAADRLLVDAAAALAAEGRTAGADRLELDLLLRRIGLRLRARGFGVDDLTGLVTRAQELGEATGDRAGLCESLAAAGITALTGGDPQAARTLVGRAVTVAEASAEPALRHLAHQAAARIAFNTGQIDVARAEVTICLEVLDAAASTPFDRPGVPPVTGVAPSWFTIGLAAFVARVAGDHAAAGLLVRRCLRAAEESHDPVAGQLAHYYAGFIAAWDGRYAEAERHLEASAQGAPEQQSPYFRHSAEAVRGWVLARQGDPVVGLRTMDVAVAAMAGVRALPWMAYAEALRAEARLLTGDVEGARAAASAARARLAPAGEPYAPDVLRILGETLAADPATRQDAVAVLQEGISLARAQGALGFVPGLVAALGRVQRPTPGA
jgi:DNA-binding SARP family transcriptional activator